MFRDVPSVVQVPLASTARPHPLVCADHVPLVPFRLGWGPLLRLVVRCVPLVPMVLLQVSRRVPPVELEQCR